MIHYNRRECGRVSVCRSGRLKRSSRKSIPVNRILKSDFRIINEPPVEVVHKVHLSKELRNLELSNLVLEFKRAPLSWTTSLAGRQNNVLLRKFAVKQTQSSSRTRISFLRLNSVTKEKAIRLSDEMVSANWLLERTESNKQSFGNPHHFRLFTRN